ncbi:MAG: PKD domain-containing protein [Bacteroidetes bacterium]|nr:PKD domain-containing protein [Bacteroidota bacterium]
MLIIKYTLFGFLLIISFASKAQNFQKVYDYDDTTVLFSGIHIENDSFYVTGDFGKAGVRSLGLLSPMDKFGNESKISLGNNDYLHNLGFTFGRNKFNDDGIAYSFYSSVKKTTGYGVPTYLNFDLLGDLLFEDYGQSFWTDFTAFFDGAVGCIKNSKYYGAGQFFYDGVTDTTSNEPSRIGIAYMCFDINGLIWKREIITTSLRSLLSAEIMTLSDNRIGFIYNDSYLAPNLTGSNSKIHFVELDTNGNILRDRIFQPHPFTQAASGVQLVNNGQNYLMTYSESKQAFYAGQNTVIIRPVVALLDTALNVVWKDSISLFWWGAVDGIELRGISPKDYIIQDSNFVFAHNYPYGFGLSDTIPFTCVLIQNRKLLTGETNWNRSFQYYTDSNFNNQPNYELYDASFVPWDSGYVFVGTSYNLDSLGAGVPGQLGYVLKTNCLGHLGDPVAGASYTFNDSLGVHFQSTSIQDGSVTWHFGDGETETRGEYQDSVFHQYDSSGTQEIMLLAHGCLGVMDTLLFTIEIPAYTPPIDTTETPEEPTVVYTKTLAIGPNPASTGEPLSAYLGDLPEGGATLFFYDQNGKILQQFSFPQGQSMYLLPLELAAGVYQLVLRSGEKILDKERLVVR